MASLTIAIDPETLEAAKLEAERRQISLDQLVNDTLTALVPRKPAKKRNQRLVDLMNEGVLGHIDQPLTREEIYAERTWPRS